MRITVVKGRGVFTAKSFFLGRSINQISNGPNIELRQIHIDVKPHIVFFAARHIEEGEELLYTYGDRRKSVINAGNEFLLPAPAVADGPLYVYGSLDC